jgi:hydroxyacylglutathione hydrolase
LEVTVAHFLRDRDRVPVQLVDVRDVDEWPAGRMPGARLIPLADLAMRADELDPARPVVLVCRSGRRSLVAAALLQARGFRAARSLAGGMLAWAEAGQPVER